MNLSCHNTCTCICCDVCIDYTKVVDISAAVHAPEKSCFLRIGGVVDGQIVNDMSLSVKFSLEGNLWSTGPIKDADGREICNTAHVEVVYQSDFNITVSCIDHRADGTQFFGGGDEIVSAGILLYSGSINSRRAHQCSQENRKISFHFIYSFFMLKIVCHIHFLINSLLLRSTSPLSGKDVPCCSARYSDTEA